MTEWTGALVAKTVGGEGPAEPRYAHVSTDTRMIAPGDLFVALVGDRFDGHEFLAMARDRGAVGAVVRAGTPPVEGLALYPVPDPRRALGQLARRRRHDVPGPVVAVTGTNGKTSTKEFAAAVVATRWRTHATAANLNNEIGVPLTMLQAPDDIEALVVEAGASLPGEIGRLRDMIAPDVGVVTNVSPGHVAGFGSEEAILTEKVALLDGIPLAVVGMDPTALSERARALAGRVVTASLDPAADVHPDGWRLGADGRCVLRRGGREVVLPAAGRHLGDNATLAIGVGDLLEVDPGAALRALASARIPGGRCQVLHAGELTILHDAYNANPASVAAALDTVEALRGGRPLVVVVGTMLELGAASAVHHQRLAARIVAAGPRLVGALGDFAAAFESHRAVLGDRLIVAEDAETLGRRVADRMKGDEVVLLKASRGIRLERALPYLLPDREVPCSTTS